MLFKDRYIEYIVPKSPAEEILDSSIASIEVDKSKCPYGYFSVAVVMEQMLENIHKANEERKKLNKMWEELSSDLKAVVCCYFPNAAPVKEID